MQKKASPFITVIIPAYNSAKTLRWALLSVQAQEFQDFEVRVVGDGCTDESCAIVASFNDARFHWTNLPVNSGSQATPNNQGLQEARGCYIAYLGHDDLWFPWHLSNLLACLENNRADFAFSFCASFGPEGIRNPLGPLPVGGKLETHFTPPSSWMHRKDLVDLCGWWRTDVEALDCPIDREFWRRACRAGKQFHFCPALSVLKFPSPWWKSYQRITHHPQEPFLTPLFERPRELHVQVLTELAIYGVARQAQAPKAWWKRAAWRLIELYGMERWPLFPMLRWRFQRLRRQIWLQRGLPPSKPYGVDQQIGKAADKGCPG